MFVEFSKCLCEWSMHDMFSNCLCEWHTHELYIVKSSQNVHVNVAWYGQALEIFVIWYMCGAVLT
jgi:hypothetical protein